MYGKTGSRQIIDLNEASTGGQYDTISNLLVDLASSPVIPPEGDLGHAFGNNQRIAKTWHIEVDSKVKVSVITTHIWLSLNKNGKLEESKNLKPVQWYKNTSVIKNIRDVEDPLFLVLDKEHYNSLYHIIKANIKSVANEQRNTSRDLIDFIDKKFERDGCLVCSVFQKNGISIQYKRRK